MAKFAEGTTVTPESSRLEIERILKRYGASKFVSGWEDDRAVIAFEMKNRRIRFIVVFPPLKNFQYSPGGKYRTVAQMKLAQEAEVRRLWRSLVQAIKSKLDLIDSGIVAFEDEFLAYTLKPDGETFGEWARDKFDYIMESGQMPPLLQAGR